MTAADNESCVIRERASQHGAAVANSTLVWMDVATVCAIVAASIAFKIAFMPRHDVFPYALISSPEITKQVKIIFASNWQQILLPYAYEADRYYWCTSIIPFT